MSGRAATAATWTVAEALALLSASGLLRAVLRPGRPRECGLSLSPAAAGDLTTATFAGVQLDSRRWQSGEIFVALPGENVHGRTFAAEIMARGGWVLTDDTAGPDPLDEVSEQASAGVMICTDPVAALRALAAAWRQRQRAAVIGITGTNGKTTTKDFLTALLTGAAPTHATAGNYNNHLGVPLTLLGLRPEHVFGVVEMGASAGGEIAGLARCAQPQIGVITNASAAHLAEFGSLENVIAGKGELLDQLPPDGTAILNADSAGWTDWCRRARCEVVSLGQTRGDVNWSYEGENLVLDGVVWPVALPGEHNALNLAMAILAARAAGVTEADMRRGLTTFRSSPHRGLVREIGGRWLLDDAYNANPDSVVAAARCLLAAGQARTFAVLGHMAELGPDSVALHRETGRRVAAVGVDLLLAVGPLAEPLAGGFDAVGGGGQCCGSVAEAVRWLSERVRPGDRVLVKGSRAAAMERIIPLLELAWGESSPG